MSETGKKEFMDGVAALIAERAPELERRGAPRLPLDEEWFTSDDGAVYSVADLSCGGMALRIPAGTEASPAIGGEIRGTLSLRREYHRVRGRVRHRGSGAVGVEFADLELATVGALKRALDPESLGAELRPRPSEGLAIHYAGPGGAEILFERDIDGSVLRLTIVVLGSAVRWDRDRGLATGGARSSAEEFAPDAEPDRDKLRVAKTLMLSCKLPQDLRKWCVRRLSSLS